jgi:alpha-L-arabinofuranosidase
MKFFLFLLFISSGVTCLAQNRALGKTRINGREYHVSFKGSDSNDGTLSRPFRTIMAAVNLAMTGDVITVHAGVYREQITPLRGGNSENERIVYQAAKGEKVEIKGSEIIKGWKKLENEAWEVKIPNSFFGKFNPYGDLIRGDWFCLHQETVNTTQELSISMVTG